MGIVHPGVMDVVSEVSQRDVCLVFPTLPSALAQWPTFISVLSEKHASGCVAKTRTAIVTRCNHRALRLWVPYEPEPTMPMDSSRRGFHLMSTYFSDKEMRQWL